MIVTPTEESSTIFELKKLTNGTNGHVMTNTENHEQKKSEGSSSLSCCSHPDSNSSSCSLSALEKLRQQADGEEEPPVLNMGSTDSAGNNHGRGCGHSYSGGDSSCGLVRSLFPSGCRGRAEAFARRLHRRLTSLGSGDVSPQRNVDTSKMIPRETTWLHPSPCGTNSLDESNERVLRRQPRHSPENDLFYDLDGELDLEENETVSPAEEASTAEQTDLLVNAGILKANHHDACHCYPNGPRLTVDCDAEFDCRFASPVSETPPDSESSEIYFDPESSDVEKIKSEDFFDTITNSESEALPNSFNNSDNSTVKGSNRPASYRIVDRKLVDREDTSDSSLSSGKNEPLEKRDLPDELRSSSQREYSSEESLNGRSSIETTSQSHESLWSTFDDDDDDDDDDDTATVSLKEEYSVKPKRNYTESQICFPKSHSDSEILDNTDQITTAQLEPPILSEQNEVKAVEEDDFVGVSSALNGSEINSSENQFLDSSKDFAKETEHRSYSNYAEDSTESTSQEENDVEQIEEEILTNHSDVEVEEISNNSKDIDTIDVSDEFVVKCSMEEKVDSAATKNELHLDIARANVASQNDDEKNCRAFEETDIEEDTKEKELFEHQTSRENRVAGETPEEEEEERPQRIRRCSSLKTGKTPPGTPGRKKIVRFADVLGLDLADVRTFLDEIPKVPNSAYSDLIYDDICQKETGSTNMISSSRDVWSGRNERRGTISSVPGKFDRTLVPLFQQPGGLATFFDLVRERKVCLENAIVQDPVTPCIQGTVRVINIDFHKSVHIRYTLNSWKNFSDLQATYVQNSCDGFSDKFSFCLYCHTLSVGQKLEFAVRFQCKGTQYWDNNNGINYCFQCLPISSPIGYIPITVQEKQSNEWTPTFY